MLHTSRCALSVFFNDTATTEIYPLSLHDALPISIVCAAKHAAREWRSRRGRQLISRSEEHTSELQSHSFISYAVFCLKKIMPNSRTSPVGNHADRGRHVHARLGQ